MLLSTDQCQRVEIQLRKINKFRYTTLYRQMHKRNLYSSDRERWKFI